VGRYWASDLLKETWALRHSETLRELNDEYQIIDRLQSAATAANLTKAAGGVLGGAQVVFGAVFNILTVVVLTIYFMAAFDWLRLAGCCEMAATAERVRRHTAELAMERRSRLCRADLVVRRTARTEKCNSPLGAYKLVPASR
jgi:hypothetical protein